MCRVELSQAMEKSKSKEYIIMWDMPLNSSKIKKEKESELTMRVWVRWDVVGWEIVERTK